MCDFDWDIYAEDIIEHAFLTNNFQLIIDKLGQDVFDDILKSLWEEE